MSLSEHESSKPPWDKAYERLEGRSNLAAWSRREWEIDEAATEVSELLRIKSAKKRHGKQRNQVGNKWDKPWELSRSVSAYG